MKTRGIIGKRIVAIKQFRPGKKATVPNVQALDSIILEGGIQLRAIVAEGEAEYFVELIRTK